MNNPARPLSSAQTFVTKLIYPLIWIGGFAFLTAILFLAPGMLESRDGTPPDAGLKWLFLGITLIGGFFVGRSCFRLKRVRMDDRFLFISNYVTEIAVPLANVAKVSENRLARDHPVTIDFLTDTEFGSRVVFMPKSRWFRSSSPHPVVEEIRSAVGQASGKLPGDAAA